MGVKRKPLSGIPRHRGQRFPDLTRDRFVEWDVSCGPDVMGEYSRANLGKRIDITLKIPGRPQVQMRLTEADAYAFKADIERAIDQACGV